VRLAWQAKGERNFHIFYQLLAGETDEHVRSAWGLRACDQYAYLSQVCVALRCVALRCARGVVPCRRIAIWRVRNCGGEGLHRMHACMRLLLLDWCNARWIPGSNVLLHSPVARR
jgi:hypothetical protein